MMKPLGLTKKGFWDFIDAKVFGDAWIFGDARVCENALVYGNAKVYQDTVELQNDARVTVNQLKTGVVFMKDGKVMKKIEKKHVEMTIAELEKKLGIKNLKIVK